MTLHVGQTASRHLTLTADHVQKYSEISGDYNPLHYDEAFAALPDAAPLEDALGRTVLEGGAGDRAGLTDYVLRTRTALAGQPLSALCAGEVTWETYA